MNSSQPSPAALAWAADVLGAAAPARTVRRLDGGTHAATDLVETTAPVREAVLRRFPAGDGAAAQEARVLRALDGLGGWVPRLVGADPEGARCGQPTTLITRLPGHSEIRPEDPRRAAVQLGRALARLHAVPYALVAGFPDGVAAAFTKVARPPEAGGDGRYGPAAAVWAAHAERLAGQERVLTHYDFWSGNVLWRDGALTGVIDWSGAALAPRGFDVGWCRLDLVLLHGREVAEVFLEAYEETAGEAVPDAVLWDLSSAVRSHRSVETWVPNYYDLGRTDLTAGELRRRHTDWTAHCLARHGRR